MSAILRVLLLVGGVGAAATVLIAAAEPAAQPAGQVTGQAAAAPSGAAEPIPKAAAATTPKAAAGPTPPATSEATSKVAAGTTPSATAGTTPPAAAATSPPAAAETTLRAAADRPLEPGDFVMPKVDCRIFSKENEVPLKGRILPLVVQSITGDQVEVGFGRTAATSLVRLEEAEAYYAGVLASEPRSVDAYHLRAMARMERQDIAGAIADLDAAIELIPNIPRLYTKRAHAYLKFRDPQTKKLKFPERIRADCIAAAQLNRNEVWAYCNRLLLQSELNPGNAWAGYEDYQRIQLIAPQDAESCHVRGMIFRTMGLPVQAVRDFDRAIDLEPYFARCYANRASAYRLRGKKTEALRDYETAIRLSPKDIDGYAGRCSYYLAENEPKLAFADAEKALALSPKDVGVLAAFANSLCNVKDPTLRDGTRALKLAQEAYEIDPADWRALNSMGSAYAEVRNFEKSEEYFRKALEMKHQMSPNEAQQTAYFINRVRSGLYPEHD
jgi:tetratricopeptide (TPR) repeat protein